jgi:molybdate transport system substrate-binding protein
MRIATSAFGSRSVRAALFGIAAVTAFPAASAAQLKVIISGGFSAAYTDVVPEFERTTRLSVVTASGSSQGDGPTTIGAQLRNGMLFDVVIMNTTGLADLVAQGRVVKGTERDLAQVSMGLAVRAGSPPPNVSTADALKETLRLARVVAGSASSASSVAALLSRLGIADSVAVKVGPRYTDANSMVARGDAEIAIQPASEILNMPGVDLGGTIPSSVQPAAVYAAAIVAGSTHTDEAKRLIAFLSSDIAKTAIKKSGMEPLPQPNRAGGR